MRGKAEEAEAVEDQKNQEEKENEGKQGKRKEERKSGKRRGGGKGGASGGWNLALPSLREAAIHLLRHIRETTAAAPGNPQEASLTTGGAEMWRLCCWERRGEEREGELQWEEKKKKVGEK